MNSSLILFILLSYHPLNHHDIILQELLGCCDASPTSKGSRRPKTRSASVGSRPQAVESRPEGTGEPQQMGSRTDLEQQTVTDNPEVLERVGKVEVEDLGPSSDEDEQE